MGFARIGIGNHTKKPIHANPQKLQVSTHSLNKPKKTEKSISVYLDLSRYRESTRTQKCSGRQTREIIGAINGRQ